MQTTTNPPTIEVGPLLDDEAQFISALTSPGYEVSISEPDGHPDPDQLWDILHLCLRVHRKAEGVTLRVRPLIGKFLLMAKDNPDTYEKRGFGNYSDFISMFVCGQMGLSRSALYEARMVADRLPSITPEIYQELGPTKALTLAKVTRSEDPKFDSYLNEARSRTASEFIRWNENRGNIEPGEMDRVTILIYTNKTLETEWMNFIGEIAVQHRCGSNNPADILRCCIQECLSGWLADYKESQGNSNGYQPHLS